MTESVYHSDLGGPAFPSLTPGPAGQHPLLHHIKPLGKPIQLVNPTENYSLELTHQRARQAWCYGTRCWREQNHPFRWAGTQHRGLNVGQLKKALQKGTRGALKAIRRAWSKSPCLREGWKCKKRHHNALESNRTLHPDVHQRGAWEHRPRPGRKGNGGCRRTGCWAVLSPSRLRWLFRVQAHNACVHVRVCSQPWQRWALQDRSAILIV